MGTRSGNEQSGRTLPQSMRHQRILDIAAKQPQASMESIGEEVPSATVELVEHVLEEYGDPADDDTTVPITTDDTKPDSEPKTESTSDEDSSLQPNGGNEVSLEQEGDDESGLEQAKEDDAERKPDQPDGEVTT